MVNFWEDEILIGMNAYYHSSLLLSIPLFPCFFTEEKYNENVKKAFSLIELLVTVTIFSIVLSIMIFFFIRSQRHIINEQEAGYVQDLASLNLGKIREKILKAERILLIEERKITLQSKTGQRDSIFQENGAVIMGNRKLTSSGNDLVWFLWKDPESENNGSIREVDENNNGILEYDEIQNLDLLYVRYNLSKVGKSVDYSSAIYLRK